MLKRLTAPFRNYFNNRFVAVTNSISALEAQLESVRRSLSDEHAGILGVTSLVGRSVNELLDGADGTPGGLSAHRPDPFVNGIESDLTQDLADVANYVSSHRGWASQAGLWFNPPISVEHTSGAVRVADVNERVAEVPFVYTSAGQLPLGSRILDVGASESTVAVGLASLGYLVTALDPRRYPLAHANLKNHVGTVEDFSSDELFDAAIMLSSVEHFGLGAYGLPKDATADRRAVERTRELVRPGGLLILTTPFGLGVADEFQRTYSKAQLDALLEGWDVQQRSYLTRVSRTEWRHVADLEESDGAHVALVRAVRPRD